MDDSTAIVIMLAAVFVAGVVTGATALGFAQITAPALALLVDARLAVLILAVTVPVISGLQVIHHRRAALPARRLLPVLGGALVGVGIGVYLLTVLPSAVIAAAVGASSVAYVTVRATRYRPSVRPEHELYVGPVAGLGSGVLNGTIGLSGPVLIPYLLALRLPLATFGYAISVMYATMSLFRLFGLLVSGAVVGGTVVLGLVLLVPALVGQRVGFVLQPRIRTATFERLVLASLIVGAVALLARAIGF